MPALRNPRQEALAQAIAAGTGKTQLQMYQEAGYSGETPTAAAKVCNHPDVKTRAYELIQERHERERAANRQAIDDAAIDKGYIVRRLKFITDRAIRGTMPVYDKDGQVTSWLPRRGDDTAAINALKVLAQMGGYLVERVELGQPGDFARMTDDELTKEMLLVGESIGIDSKMIQRAIEGRTE